MQSQSLNNQRIAKNTILLYFRMFLTMIVTLYTSRIVLNVLGVEDFGIYNVVGGVVTMFTFINSAMAGATQRFLTFELGKQNLVKLHNVFCTSIGIHVLISLLIFILAETVGLWFMNTYMSIPPERMDAAYWVFQFSVFSAIVMIMSVPYNALIIAHEKMSAFAYISILEVLLKLAIVYVLLIVNTDKLKLYAVLLFCIQLFIRLIYGRYCNKNFTESRYKLFYDKKLFVEMTSFATWSLFGNLSSVAFTQGVNILLNMFFGPIVNAARAVAVQVQSAVLSFVYNFQIALNPQITKNYATGDYKQLHLLIFASGRYSYYLLLLLSLPIVFETNYILTLWLGEVPEHTVNFLRLILCIMLVDALANPLITAASATGKIKIYQSVIGSILLMIVPISYIVLKLGAQPESVFIVHFIMIVMAQVARLFIIRPMIKLSLFRYFKEVVIKVILVTFVSIVLPLCVTLYFSFVNDFIRFVSVSFACIFSTLISVYYWGIGNEEREFIIDKKNKIKHKMFKNDSIVE